jgi:hypothetical protein
VLVMRGCGVHCSFCRLCTAIILAARRCAAVVPPYPSPFLSVTYLRLERLDCILSPLPPLSPSPPSPSQHHGLLSRYSSFSPSSPLCLSFRCHLRYSFRPSHRSNSFRVSVLLQTIHSPLSSPICPRQLAAPMATTTALLN